MKIAIVHDDLIQFGGAERLLLAITEIWPEAPVYTSVASKKWQQIFSQKQNTLKTSFLQKLPYKIKLNRHYSPFLMHSLAFESFDFSEFDVVLSVSARYAHHIITKPKTLHICYMNSPGRMFWEPQNYFKNEKITTNNFINSAAQTFLNFSLGHLRQADLVAAQKVDYFIANSKTPQKRIKKYYKRDSKIIYPFVDFEKFNAFLQKTPDLKENTQNLENQSFLVISRLLAWKRVDIAIKAFSQLQKNSTNFNAKLKIIGKGPDLKNLKELAKNLNVKNIEFLGFVSEERKIVEIKNCTALINTQLEDFGIVPLEAQVLGKPVIAFGKGGALETVIKNRTGEFFYKQNPESLVNVIKAFDSSIYSANDCIQNARKFRKELYIKNVARTVQKIYADFKKPNL